jgi:hypothetical protein
MSANEKTIFNRLLMRQAEDDFNSSRDAIEYKGGFYDIFADESKIGNIVTPPAFTPYNLNNQNLLNSGIVSSTSIGTIRFKPDGSILFLGDYTSGIVYAYSLSENFNPNTIVSTSTFATTFSFFCGLAFSNDGTRMFTNHESAGGKQYNLSTAWDITSAVFSSSETWAGASFSRMSLEFDNLGNNAYISENNTIRQYSLSSPFTFGGASFVRSFDISVATNPFQDCLRFNNDGSQMFINATGTRRIYIYNLSTNYNIATATLSTNLEYPSNVGSDTKSITFSDSGNYFYYSSATADTVYQYLLGTPEVAIKNTTNVTVSTLDNGDANGKAELDENVTTSLSGASYASDTKDLSSQISAIASGYITNNGTTYYAISTSNVVYQYTLSTAYDLSTATYDSKSLDISARSTAWGMYVREDGLKFYVVQASSVFQYAMTTPFDLSTASYDSQSANVSLISSNPRDVKFNPDGTSMYIVSNGDNAILQYDLSTAWGVNSASYASKILVMSSQNTASFSCAFTSDGTKVFGCSFSPANIYQYTLSTAWDISTATYDSLSLSLSGQLTFAKNLSLGQNNLDLIVADNNNDIYRYNVGTNNGFFTSGNFLTTSIDLTADLASNPTSVVVSSEATLPTNTTLSIAISDGTNTVTITSANFDTEVDCSALTSRTLTATWNLGTSDTSATPTINNYALYFT